MKNEFGYVGWLGEEDYLCCHRGLYSVSSSSEFHANALAPHANAHAQGVSPSIPLQPKTADACKNRLLAVKMNVLKFFPIN